MARATDRRFVWTSARAGARARRQCHWFDGVGACEQTARLADQEREELAAVRAVQESFGLDDEAEPAVAVVERPV